MTEPISCNLAEDALDYLLLAGEQAKEGSSRMLKHALATLADGVELLLKARLELKDWCLVFKDVDQATRSKYESGDFQSVVFDQAVKRLENLCAVAISINQLGIINDLRQVRNRIRHFAISTEKRAALSLIVKTFSFAIEFLTVHLRPVHDSLEHELDQLRALLGEFEEFVNARMAEIQAELDSAYLVVDCPICLQQALALGSEDVVCLFCRHHTDGKGAAHQWVDRFCRLQSLKDSLVSPQIEPCPECRAEACVNMTAETNGRLHHVCFSCGQHGDYWHCITCGSLCPSESLGAMCEDCQDHFERSND